MEENIILDETNEILPPKITKENIDPNAGTKKAAFLSWARSIIYIFISSLLISIAVYCLIKPNGFTIGGVAGIGIIVNVATNEAIDMSVFNFCLNAPLVVLSFFFVKKRFAILSSMSILLQTLWLKILELLGDSAKITFPGGGVAMMAASPENLKQIKKYVGTQTIGYDKTNQRRHAIYFKNFDGIKQHMKKQADLIRPKFEMLDELMTKELKSRGIGSWINPVGGYFICFESLEGCAKDIITKCMEAGVTMTGAGAPFPYGKDPKDNVIRIAPTYPSVEELRKAAEVFVVCVRLASVNKLLENM